MDPIFPLEIEYDGYFIGEEYGLYMQDGSYVARSSEQPENIDKINEHIENLWKVIEGLQAQNRILEEKIKQVKNELKFELGEDF